MAADSSIVIETDKQAIITPKLKDAEGNTMLWDQARSKLQAEASWSDLDNLGVGTLTPNAIGAAVFVATDVGVTGVRCDVSYVDPATGERVTGLTSDMEITVNAA